MIAEAAMNHLSIISAAVVTVITSLPWSLPLFSVSKPRKDANLLSFRGAATTWIGGLREQRSSWKSRFFRPGN